MAEINFNDVIHAINNNNLKYAVHLLKGIVEENPDSPGGWMLLGICADRPELARRIFERADKLDPGNWLVSAFQAKLQDLVTKKPGERFALISYLTSIEIQAAFDSLPKQDQDVAEQQEKTSSSKFLLYLVSGFLLVSIIFILAWVIIEKSTPLLSISDSNSTNSGGSLALPPTYTPTFNIEIEYVPTFTLTPTVAIVESNSYNDRYRSVISEIAQAQRHMENEEFVEAILVWDQIISLVPELADAFYQRGKCYLNLYGNQRVLEEARNYLNQAYDDFSTAIQLDPVNGDYYYQRAMVLLSLRGLEEFWVDYQEYLQLAYEDILEANRLGNSFQWSERTLGFQMVNIGRCQEAIEYFEELTEMAGPNAPDSAGIHTGLASAYSCLGEAEVALEHINIALEIKPSRERYTDKEYYLYYAGHYSEAYDMLSADIEESPSYGGWRYYLRALVSIALNDFEAAENDLITGFGNTWGMYYTRAYAYGLLAMEQGDTASAIEWFQLAQASFSPVQENSYFVVNTARYLQQLGGTSLFPTSTPSEYEVTPTSIPVASELLYATPTAFPAEGTEIAGFYDFNISATYNGTGPMVFLPGDYPIIRFRPGDSIQVDEIKSLYIKIEGGDVGEETTLQMMTVSYVSGGYANPINLTFGENEIRNTSGIVTPDGTIYIAIRNYSSSDEVVVDNISIRLVVVNSDGSETAYGFR